MIRAERQLKTGTQPAARSAEGDALAAKLSGIATELDAAQARARALERECHSSTERIAVKQQDLDDLRLEVERTRTLAEELRDSAEEVADANSEERALERSTLHELDRIRHEIAELTYMGPQAQLIRLATERDQCPGELAKVEQDCATLAESNRVRAKMLDGFADELSAEKSTDKE